MDLSYILKCFAIGLIGNLTLGPIFMLTLSRSARYGFWSGIATSLGASIADGTLFALGLLGILPFVETFKFAKLIFYLVGAIVLAILAYHAFRSHKLEEVQVKDKISLPLTFIKTFLLTITNPLAFAYFMGATVSVLNRLETVLLKQVFIGAGAVSLGTFSVLALVSTFSGVLRVAISQEKLKLISIVTGTVFILISIYILRLFVGVLFS